MALRADETVDFRLVSKYAFQWRRHFIPNLALIDGTCCKARRRPILFMPGMGT